MVNSFKYFDSNTILPLKWDAGTGNLKAYIKVIYITDDENIVQSVDNTFSFRATMYDTGRTIQQLTNLLMRIFVGKTSNNYDSYYDFGLVMQNNENFILTENGIDGLSHKRTDYIDTNYIPCSVYKSENNSVYAELLSNQLPSSNGWKCGDIVVLSNKMMYTHNGIEWI